MNEKTYSLNHSKACQGQIPLLTESGSSPMAREKNLPPHNCFCPWGMTDMGGGSIRIGALISSCNNLNLF